MAKSNKMYKKALEQYYKGNIEKALEFCENSISEDMGSSGAINLKGLLYYFKGELNSANALWKLNYSVNKDPVSEKYLKDSKVDKENLILYNNALVLIKKLNVNEALVLLKQCKKSDFNCINVDNYLAFCHIKKGEYETALQYIDNVLKLDRKNEMALKNKKLLIKYGSVKRQINFKKVATIIAISLIVVIVFFSGKFVVSKVNVAKTKSIKQNQENKVEVIEKLPIVKETKEESFPKEDMKGFIETKDFEKIYTILESSKDKDLSVDDGQLVKQGKKVLKDDGVTYFYDNGISNLKSGNNKDAKKWLLKAYNYGSEDYLYPHIIFMLASAFEADGEIEDCLNYYSQYDKLYSNDCYEETVLYKLALLNNDIDKEKSKVYAKKLVEVFPESDYNNSNIQQILK